MIDDIVMEYSIYQVRNSQLYTHSHLSAFSYFCTWPFLANFGSSCRSSRRGWLSWERRLLCLRQRYRYGRWLGANHRSVGDTEMHGIVEIASLLILLNVMPRIEI